MEIRMHPPKGYRFREAISRCDGFSLYFEPTGEITITVESVAEVRNITGCSLLEARDSLTQSNGDVSEAVYRLRRGGK